MKERPILFTGPMVRAILDGRKTQTRRPMKVQPDWRNPVVGCDGVAVGLGGSGLDGGVKSPFGTIGDQLWVRETWGLMAYHDTTDWCRDSVAKLTESHVREQWLVEHAANWNLPSESAYWRPSIHMPRWASRIDLEITRVRVERVQDITEEDAKVEGVTPDDYEGYEHPDNPTLSCAAHRYSFRDLWQSIYGTWDANPWVWVYEFRRVSP